MRILLLGKTGQLGTAFFSSLAPEHELVCPEHHRFDLEMTADEIRKRIFDITPDLVINAAAFTDVEKAESEPEKAFLINARAPEAIAQACDHLDIPLIHFSTDYVFDGSSHIPWKETDTPNPLNRYGASKLAGEIAVQKSADKHLIFRTSWLYGAHRHNFFKTVFARLQLGQPLKIVADQVGTPTLDQYVADAVAQIIRQHQVTGYALWRQNSGVYHLSGYGETSWYGFAEAIAQLAMAKHTEMTSIEPVTTAEYPTVAIRPAYSVLDNSLVQSRFGIVMPDWRQSLEKLMRDLQG